MRTTSMQTVQGVDYAIMDKRLTNATLDVSNLYELLDHESGEHAGVDFTFNEDRSYTAEGTVEGTNTAYWSLWFAARPDWLRKGEKYIIKMDSESGKVEQRIYFYTDDTWATRISYETVANGWKEVTVPNNCEAVIIRIIVEGSGVSVSETVHPELYTRAYFDEFMNEEDTKFSVKQFNAYDLMHKYVALDYGKEFTTNGVTFVVDNDGGIEVSGTSSGSSYYEFYRGALPEGFNPNDTLNAKMDSASGNVTLRIYFYDIDWSSETRTAYIITTDQTIAVPSNAANLIIWVGIEYVGRTADETVHPAILTRSAEGGTTYYNTNTFNYTVNRDSYTVSASPTIQAVSDYYLPPTGDTTDRTADIMTLLSTQKVCKLGTGDYYIRTGIQMPDGTAIIGSGKGTRLILDSSVTNGYVISVGHYCLVDNLLVTGLASGDLPYEEFTIGGRDGIVQLGDYVDFETPATFSANFDKLSNLWIENFTGSGVRSYRNDGAASFLAHNIDILHCGIGINIELFSEFHAWENIRCRWCVYACIMNGGNNLFSNCHFDVCIHLLKIDNSLGNLVNDTHSSFTNCTFCHANNNTGDAMEIIGVENGLVFSNCQVFYSKIKITNTNGVVITNFNFANSQEIILSGCKGINISNCIFGSTPVITKNNVTGFIFDNNMTRNGGMLSA